MIRIKLFLLTGPKHFMKMIAGSKLDLVEQVNLLNVLEKIGEAIANVCLCLHELLLIFLSIQEMATVTIDDEVKTRRLSYNL